MPPEKAPWARNQFDVAHKAVDTPVQGQIPKLRRPQPLEHSNSYPGYRSPTEVERIALSRQLGWYLDR